MPDIFSKKKRSAVMALIRSRGNRSTEARLITVFRLHGITGWRRKIAHNRTRDRLVTRSLRARGWKVLRLWEHELARQREARLLRRLSAHGLAAP